MKILIIDGQGGGIGKQLITAIKSSAVLEGAEILAVGTNTVATSAMLKSGADSAATGENAVVVGCRRADVIVGPIGIVIADSLYGEITPKMALTVGQSAAKRILIPVNHCENVVVGVPELAVNKLVAEAVVEIEKILE